MSAYKYILPVLAAMFARSGLAQAPDQAEAPTPPEQQRVEVVAEREYDFFADYKAVFAGLRAAQEAQAELAPNAVLKFFVVPTSQSGNVRVAIVGSTREIVVTTGQATAFQVPVDEELAKEPARIVVAGGGPKPKINILIQSPSSAPLKWRLGDARLLCTFLTAARKEASSGMKHMVYSLLGSNTCKVQVPVSPSEYQVVAYRKNGKQSLLSPQDGMYYFPTNLSSYPSESIVEARPLPASASAP
jgi:hypothetical protein